MFFVGLCGTTAGTNGMNFFLILFLRRTGAAATRGTCEQVWAGSTETDGTGKEKCLHPVSGWPLWTGRCAPESETLDWKESPGTPGRKVRFPSAPLARCSLETKDSRVRSLRWGDTGAVLYRGAELTQGVEGASVHSCGIFRVKEQRGDISAAQKGGVILRQRQPLQLMS